MLACLGVCLQFFLLQLHLSFFGSVELESVIEENSLLKIDVLQVYIFLCSNWARRPIRVLKPDSKLRFPAFKRVINYNRVFDPDVLQWSTFFVDIDSADFVQHIKAFGDLPEDCVLFEKALNRPICQCYEEGACVLVRGCVCRRDKAFLRELSC